MPITSSEQAQIVEARISKKSTLRTVSDGLEAIIHEALPVLDHGFVRVVDYMGDDDSIVQAARVSYGKGTKKRREDRALINYLMQNQHTTPFEMAEIKLHVSYPYSWRVNGFDTELPISMNIQPAIRFWTKSFIFQNQIDWRANRLVTVKVEEHPLWGRKQRMY